MIAKEKTLHKRLNDKINELIIGHRMTFDKLAYETISLTFSGLTDIVYGWHQYFLKQT